ncbi:MAG: hypothetical protein M3256_04315, partial [Actinomycetota bacterium]|nr:hypothetical protein [Actinomycetota bacterium]
MVQVLRAQERARAAQARAQTSAARRAEAAQKAYERSLAADAKERKRLYVESRLAHVAMENHELAESLLGLRNLLLDGLKRDPYLSATKLKRPPNHVTWDSAHLYVEEPAPRPPPPAPQPPPPAAPPRGIAKIYQGAKQRQAAEYALAVGQRDYRAALEAHAALLKSHAAAVIAHQEREVGRKARLEAELADYQRKVDEERAACAAQHAEVELLLRQFGAGDPDALRSYMG